ncbi:MAG: hypothetical protein EXX96DRAFT_474831, partial [Benjaminiella poitrasii]
IIVNLQIVVENESTKLEIDEIPIDLVSTLNKDSYLQSILSSSAAQTTTSENSNNNCAGNEACTCYKCTRQRRRAFTTTISSSKAVTSKRSNTLRKTPTLKAYERHLPKPTYSQDDSIYHIKPVEEEPLKRRDKARSTINKEQKSTSDNYQISWKDDSTGDDILTSLVTFQTIFEEKGDDNKGLSDLLEQRTEELKHEKLHREKSTSKQKSEQLPPRMQDCLTLSYRQGPRHNPLTLYHTMKMKDEKERAAAYNLAFQHCINANSGMKKWIKRKRVAPTKEASKLIQPIRTSTIKRSLLHPLSSKKSSKGSTENLPLYGSIDNSKKSTEAAVPMKNSSNMPFIPENNDAQSTRDDLSAAQVYLSATNNEHHFLANTTIAENYSKMLYVHIDTPGRPRQKSASTTTSEVRRSYCDKQNKYVLYI